MAKKTEGKAVVGSAVTVDGAAGTITEISKDGKTITVALPFKAKQVLLTEAEESGSESASGSDSASASGSESGSGSESESASGSESSAESSASESESGS